MAISDPLLATKLQVPPPRAGAVPRPRLAARLDAGLTRGLVVVSAAAGYGKTDLVGAWAAHADRPVAWVALEPGDSDPARFWAYVAAALRALPGLSVVDPPESIGDVGSIGRSDAAGSAAAGSAAAVNGNGSGWEATRVEILNAVAGSADPAVLVLDDFHLVASPAVHAGVAAFLDRLPPNLGVILVSRGDPPLPLGRFRLQGRLAELRAEDLRFGPEEARRLIHQQGGITLDERDLTTLMARTEGWPAGLTAAALALRGRSAAEASAFVAAFAGSHRYVLDFLDEEIIDRLAPGMREFLLTTSVLDRLTGPLCDALTGDPEGSGAVMLEALERASLFTTPLDDARSWYRYHTLFAERLRDRLRRERPGDEAELHRRASEWYARHGLIGDAVQHAGAAGDALAAAALIEAAADDELARGAFVTVETWIRALPEPVVRARPRLAILLAQALIHTASLEAAEAWLSIAEVALGALGAAAARSATVDELRLLRGRIAAVRARIAAWRRDAAGTVMHGRAALADLPVDSPLRADVALSVGTAHHVGGAARDAADAFAEAVRLCQATGQRFQEASALCMLAEARKAEGRLREAGKLAARSIDLAQVRAGRTDPLTGRVAVVMGHIHVEHMDFDAARDCAETALGCAAHGGSRVTLIAGQILLASASAAAGAVEFALRTVSAAEEAARTHHAPELAGGLAVFRAQLAWQAGDTLSAVRWADAYALARAARAPARPFERDAGDSLLARIRMGQGRLDEALALAEGLIPECEQTGRGEALLRHRILLALIHQARGDTRLSLETVEFALESGGPEGYAWSFVREGKPLAELLRACAARGVVPEDLGRLLALMRSAGDGRAEPRRAPGGYLPAREDKGEPAVLVEPLTQREIEVLRLVAAGLSNREIADTLVISIGTVKRHITNLHGKLGVETRTRAIARGRELGLVR
jgi:LuxR family maltose regulon positive regulatory protein